MRVQRNIAPPNGRTYYLDGDVTASIADYHQRCLPSNLFHKLAGSRPAGQSPAVPSLGNEHVIGGGLSPNTRRRKRPSRRTRYKRTAARQATEQRAREERLHQRTLEMTIEQTLDRGGTPKLCDCDTFTDRAQPKHSLYAFLTPHGYCQYCGGWTPAVFRAACGEPALALAIGELERWKRDKMTALCGIAS